MGKNSSKNHGKNIGDIVHAAFRSGDLSRLQDLGPAIEKAVRDLPFAGTSSTSTSSRFSGKPYPTGTSTSARLSDTPQHGGHPYRQSHLPAQQRPVLPALQKKMRSSTLGVPALVLGIMGLVTFGLSTIIFSILTALSVLGTGFWSLVGGFAAIAGASAVLIGGGWSKRKLVGRLRQYETLFDQKSVWRLDDMASQLGIPPAQIKKDIQKAKRRNLLLEVRMDASETNLMRGEDAYRFYLESEASRRQREASEEENKRLLSDPETAQMLRFKQEGIDTIRKIQAANDEIPGEEISEKLYALEMATANIFHYVEKHPNKLPDTRKFMNYYLPTTLKLVEKYRQYERMEIQPPNIQQAKTDIETTLATINVAFRNLLAGLYQDDTLDVATDIDVLQTMLAQEGLTGEKFIIETDTPNR